MTGSTVISGTESAGDGTDDTAGSGGDDTNTTVSVDSSEVTPPVVIEDDSSNRDSGLQDSNSSVTLSQNDTLTAGATGTTGTAQTGTGSGDGSSAPTTDFGTTDIADLTTVTDINAQTVQIDVSPSVSGSVDAGDQTTDSGTSVVSNLLSFVGLGLPLSATDDPIAPLPGAMLVASLDMVRRDLEQSDVQLTGEAVQTTTDALLIDEQSNDSGRVSLMAAEEEETPPEPPSSEVSDPLTVDPTSEERIAGFQKAQDERLDAFNEAQAARIKAFNEQLSAQAEANPLGALVGSAAFVVSELVNTAAVVVTEFVNYISFAIGEFIHGISDWFIAPAIFTGLYGDPVLSEQFWRAQSSQNCVLMATAMMIGELTGTSPTEDEIVEIAKNLDSVVNPGTPMYQGLESQDGVAIKDAVELLKTQYNITATVTEYEKTEGNLALRVVAFALEENKAVSVGVHNYTIWNGVEGKELPEGVTRANHQVVVTGIDFDERIVIINDSGYGDEPDGTNKGKNMRVPLDIFMKAWQFDDYETMIAVCGQGGCTRPAVAADAA